MKGTLIGSDYLKQGNELKFLEINTNIAIHKEVDWLDIDPLLALLTGSNVTEFHLIHQGIDTAQYPFIEESPDEGYYFANQLSSSLALHNISFTSHEVAQGAITVPYIEDADHKFILRQSYDNTAIIDSSYAADNFEFFTLMSGSNYSPKLFQSSSADGMYIDTLGSLDLDTPHPSIVVKSRYPSGDGNLQTYKFTDTSSIDADLNNLKANLDEDYSIQEFINSDSNIVSGSWSVIRGIDILYGSNLDVLHLGGYKQSSYLKLNDWDVTYSGSTQVLDTRSKILYNSKNYGTSKTFYHSDAETLVLKSDGTSVSGSDLIVGDDIKSVLFDFEQGYERSGSTMDSGPEFLGHFGYLSNISSSLQYVTSTLVNVSQGVNDMPMINITLNDGTTLLDSPNQHFLIEESGSNLTYFEFVNYFIPGDKICYLDTSTNKISKKEITSLSTTWGDPSLNIFNYDFEPSDFFLSHQSASQYLIMHNSCHGCGWSGCGPTWCDNTCVQCSGGGQIGPKY